MLRIKNLRFFKNKEILKNFILSVLEEYGFKYNPKFDYDLEPLNNFYLKKGNIFFVLTVKNKIFGTIGIKMINTKTAKLKRFYLAKNLRGKGWGTKMFKKALTFCKKEGYEKILTDVAYNMPQGLRFYVKNKFKIIKKEKNNLFLERKINT